MSKNYLSRGTYHIGDQWRLRWAYPSAVSPEPSLFAHMKYGSRWRVQPKIRHLAPLDGCTCMSLRRTKSTIISWAGSFHSFWVKPIKMSVRNHLIIQEQNLAFSCVDTVKLLKIWTPEKYTVTPKIWLVWIFHRKMYPNDADGMANSLALIRAVWPGSTLFAQTCLSENLGLLLGSELWPCRDGE